MIIMIDYVEMRETPIVHEKSYKGGEVAFVERCGIYDDAVHMQKRKKNSST